MPVTVISERTYQFPEPITVTLCLRWYGVRKLILAMSSTDVVYRRENEQEMSRVEVGLENFKVFE